MGYPVDLFTDLQPVNDEFLCPICHDVLQDVVMLDPCDHTFCRTCIDQWNLRSSSSSPSAQAVLTSCPVDRQRPVGFKRPQRPFMNMLNELRLHCPFSRVEAGRSGVVAGSEAVVVGCGAVLTLDQVLNHVQRCEFNPDVPRACDGGCGAMLTRTESGRGGGHSCVAYLEQLLREKQAELQRREHELSLASIATQNPTTPFWTGILEWNEKSRAIAGVGVGTAGSDPTLPVVRQINCRVSSTRPNNEAAHPLLDFPTWPAKLVMQLIPKVLVGNLGDSYFHACKEVKFELEEEAAAATSLNRFLLSGYAGSVHFHGSPSCSVKVLILLYSPNRRMYLGFIPENQAGFVDRLRTVIQEGKAENQRRRERQQGHGHGSGLESANGLSGNGN